ncbi:hypothetical protein IV52_GL001107 [Fructilactobacillus lindneri DSM 20690 = JCM 11027]|uniref:Integral membrane protein n=1 Tax=Fructilactobacillus lindneri DSM 20690 = JCM 11027 TaxID=1122148 RepID=A0A0R2JNT5_9LACO|nr:hypothetical protein IV52_GL001107 [Fructilactobacillus lindneri DSM 20690 = JCM 11027]
MIAAIIESVLLIPVIGGVIVVSTLWFPLIALIGLYIAGLVIVSQAETTGGSDRYATELSTAKTKYIVGIACAAIAFIPFIGWILHIVMAVMMWLQFVTWTNIKEKLSKDNIIADVKAEDVKSDDDKEAK